MSDCLFCKIANGEIPTNFLYEDDLVVAFPDINPLTPTHVLVVPKKHYENITDNVPAETLAAIAHAVKVVTEQTGIDKTDSVASPIPVTTAASPCTTCTSTCLVAASSTSQRRRGEVAWSPEANPQPSAMHGATTAPRPWPARTGTLWMWTR